MPNQRLRYVAIALLVILVVGACLACGGAAFWLVRSGTARELLDLPAQGGDTLRLYGDMPSTLDPALVQDTTSAGYVLEIFSGLVTLSGDLEIVPDLAERWEINPDGTRYVFYLRPEARFHDGKPVTAQDVKFSIERACDPDLGSPVASSYLGDIVGAAAVLAGEADEVKGVRVIDDRTLEIVIDSPKAYFLPKLAYSTAFVVDRDNVAQPDWMVHPNGTGPFKLESLTSDEIVLARNDDFYRGPAKLAQVRFLLGGGLPITMYENDSLDLAYVGLGDIERVLDPANALSRELVIVSSLGVQYIGMNVQAPPFDDPLVRRAFVHATDREKLAEVVLKGTAVPAWGILPPEMPGYNPALEGLAYEPALARELLAQSRYGGAEGLPPITLHTSGDDLGLPSSVEALLAFWKENLGVEVQVEAVDWPVFLAEVDANLYPMFSLGWMADYPDPHNFLDQLFYSQSDENHVAYANPEVDRLLLAARVERDPAERMALYQQAEAMIVQDAAWIPLWHDRDYMLIKPYVKGVSPASTLVPWLKDVYLERE